MAIQNCITANKVYAAKVMEVSQIEKAVPLASSDTQTHCICGAKIGNGCIVYIPCRSVRAGCQQLGRVIDVLIVEVVEVDEGRSMAVGVANEIS